RRHPANRATATRSRRPSREASRLLLLLIRSLGLPTGPARRRAEASRGRAEAAGATRAAAAGPLLHVLDLLLLLVGEDLAEPGIDLLLQLFQLLLLLGGQFQHALEGRRHDLARPRGTAEAPRPAGAEAERRDEALALAVHLRQHRLGALL